MQDHAANRHADAALLVPQHIPKSLPLIEDFVAWWRSSTHLRSGVSSTTAGNPFTGWLTLFVQHQVGDVPALVRPCSFQRTSSSWW